jgi:hypothetical protein
LQAISSPHIVKFEPVIEEEKVMLTTSQLLGLSKSERDAAINTIAGEAYQGAQGADIAAVAANLFSRRFSPKYAGNIVDVVKAPGQYAANFNTSREDIVRPDLISAADRERIATVFDNPMLIRDAVVKGNAPLQFRGTTLYKNRKEGDYTPVEGKSNFYFDPASKEVKDSLLSKLDSGETAVLQPQGDAVQAVEPTSMIEFVETPAAGSSPPSAAQREAQYKNAVMSSLISEAMKPKRSGLINPMRFMMQYMQ